MPQPYCADMRNRWCVSRRWVTAYERDVNATASLVRARRSRYTTKARGVPVTPLELPARAPDRLARPAAGKRAARPADTAATAGGPARVDAEGRGRVRTSPVYYSFAGTGTVRPLLAGVVRNLASPERFVESCNEIAREGFVRAA
jgi:hypothetical protein